MVKSTMTETCSAVLRSRRNYSSSGNKYAKPPCSRTKIYAARMSRGSSSCRSIGLSAALARTQQQTLQPPQLLSGDRTDRRTDGQRTLGRFMTRDVVLKRSGVTPETRLRQRFLNILGLHTCCTEIILHCVSVSNQL